MQIIPVIDLKDGVVVHAVRGERSRYQPIHLHSQLTRHSDIAAVLAGFLHLYPFRLFYIADLNAITGQGDNRPLLTQLLTDYPALNFWIDDGSPLTQINPLPFPNYKTVLGTESQPAPVQPLSNEYILSLDFKQQQPAGHLSWFTQARFWPEQIIVMTLNRVGGKCGPDFEKLAALRTAHPDKRFVAAGGIRDGNDLKRLKAMGISAALLATALHEQAIDSTLLDEIANSGCV